MEYDEDSKPMVFPPNIPKFMEVNHMYCNQCGKQIPDNSRFCSFCGSRINNCNTNNERIFVEMPFVDQRKLEQDERKGTLVYLHDVLSMEFSVNKLERALKIKKDSISIHDDWFFWKHFRFKYPIKGLPHNEFDPPKIGLYLSYSYRLNRYFYMFDEGDAPYFTDIDGNMVNHQFGNPCHGGLNLSSVLDQKKRDWLCTPPVLEKKLFSSSYVITNRDSTYWRSVEAVVNNKDQLEVFAQVKPIIEQFEMMVRDREKRYQEGLPRLKAEIEDISEELNNAKRILSNLYDVNMIPSKYRNIGCAYFIYDFFSTSNLPLNNVFLHLDLDKIQSQLDTVIKNQRDIILQQAIIISQNEEMIAQNQKLFKELSAMNKSVNTTLNSIQESSDETSEWARIAALNAETCAWIGFANYIKK